MRGSHDQVLARPKKSAACERYPGEGKERWQATSRTQAEKTVELKHRCFALIDAASLSCQRDSGVIGPPKYVPRLQTGDICYTGLAETGLKKQNKKQSR